MKVTCAESSRTRMDGTWSLPGRPCSPSPRDQSGPRHSMCRLVLLLLMAVALWCQPARADSVEQINSKSRVALEALAKHARGAGELLEAAAGVLVFPDMVKIGFGVGGQYGEGVLLVDGKPESYYASAGASFGLQLGVQYKSEVIVFMTRDVLDRFRASRGWEVGVDSSVALIKAGAGGRFDTRNVKQPVVGFIFSNTGLMYNLTLEGSRITRIAR